MNGRFEVLILDEESCLIRYRDSRDTVLLASSTIPGFDLAERTIEWLRSALQKDWLYQIGRAYQGNGPVFTLSAPFGVVCTSPPFTSSDQMERAIAALKPAVVSAPVVKVQGNAEASAPAPVASPAPRAEPVRTLASAGLDKKRPPARAAQPARMAPRER